MSTPLTLPSFAKINWSLRVLGRRPDGYHEIDTIFQTVSLHDDITFIKSQHGIVLECDNPEIPVDESNLIVRAAGLLQNLAAVNSGVRIKLTKRIPSPGGLGGGSSNAAVALIGLARVWNIRLTNAKLLEIAAVLGADVPFFLMGGTARGTGTGTELHEMTQIAETALVLVTPPAKLATASVYEALNCNSLTKKTGVSMLSDSHWAEGVSHWPNFRLHNDFEPVVMRLKPEIDVVKLALARCAAKGTLLSGSGATVFGVFDNTESQLLAAAKLGNSAGWKVAACTTMTREQYVAAYVGVDADLRGYFV